MTKARSLSDFIESDGSVTLVDNQKIKIGTSNDLEIFHDGNHSFIQESGTGDLIIYGTGEDLAKFKDDGAVELYNDGSLKLATTSTGVSVTGEIDLSDDINIVDGKAARFGTGEDFSIFNDGSNTYLRNSTSNQDINFLGNDDGSANVTMLTLDASDGGTATFNHDVKLGDNGKVVFGAGDDLQIFHDGSNSRIKDVGTGDLILSGNIIAFQNAANSETMAKFSENGAVDLYYNDSKKLETTSTGIKIGTGDSPVDGDANDLVVMNTSGGSGITVSSASNSVSSLRFGDTDLARSGMFYYNHNDNSLRIDTAGSSRMFIYSNGMTTIDASSGSSIGNLRVKGTSGHSYIGVSRAAESQGEVGYTWNNNVSNVWWNYLSANSSILTWYSTSGTKMTLNNSSGDLGLSSGNLVVTNGKGISFSSTANAGNSASMDNELLNDYESGAWTPKVQDLGGNEATGYQSGYPTGVYTKIGDMCYITFSIRVTNIGSMTGSYVHIANLPFNRSTTTEGRGSGGIDYFSGFAAPKSYLALDASSSTSVLWLVGGGSSTNATGSHYITVANLGSSFMFKGWAMYKTP